MLLVVWLASFFVPGGRYELDPETGGPVPGTYQELPACDAEHPNGICEDNSLDAQFGLLWRAPPNGLYGIENAERGQVGAPTRSGSSTAPPRSSSSCWPSAPSSRSR